MLKIKNVSSIPDLNRSIARERKWTLATPLSNHLLWFNVLLFNYKRYSMYRLRYLSMF